MHEERMVAGGSYKSPSRAPLSFDVMSAGSGLAPLPRPPPTVFGGHAGCAEAARATTAQAMQGGEAMHKYPALTALAIALNIMMLAPAVSASLTPTSAERWCGNSDTAVAHRNGISVPLALESNCICKCKGLAVEKEKQACLSKCVNAFEAARRR
jgi:hypothetical protein